MQVYLSVRMYVCECVTVCVCVYLTVCGSVCAYVMCHTHTHLARMIDT